MTDKEENERPQKQNKTKEEFVLCKTTADIQRMKLERLMKHPTKPVEIPEKRKERKWPEAPQFIRNVMGSSAGAGSGEFHIYRHIRRREYAREKFMEEKSHKADLDDEYHRKIEKNQQEADARTAKKRAKRLKMKEKLKAKKKKSSEEPTEQVSEKRDTSDESEVED